MEDEVKPGDLPKYIYMRKNNLKWKLLEDDGNL